MNFSRPATPQRLGMIEALVPIVVLVGLVGLSFYLYGDAGIFGPNQVALTFAAMVAVFIGCRRGHSLEALREGLRRCVWLCRYACRGLRKLRIFIWRKAWSRSCGIRAQKTHRFDGGGNRCVFGVLELRRRVFATA